MKANAKYLGSKYGFLLHLHRIADSGLFNKTGFTAFESAQGSNFWSAFSWLSMEIDKQDE